jgi:hypothetical protein
MHIFLVLLLLFRIFLMQREQHKRIPFWRCWHRCSCPILWQPAPYKSVHVTVDIQGSFDPHACSSRFFHMLRLSVPRSLAVCFAGCVLMFEAFIPHFLAICSSCPSCRFHMLSHALVICLTSSAHFHCASRLFHVFQALCTSYQLCTLLMPLTL